MADPLTAIGSAAAILQLTEEAAKLGIFLCKLYKDTKHVDKTVDQLGLEVVTLGDTWTIVHIEVKKIIAVTSGASSASTSVYDSNGQLWKCICDQVQHCWNTLKELQKVVETIGVAHGNIIAQVIRQIKVDWSKEDISGIRQRVGLHMSSIQVILLLINIKIAHLAPGQASNQLLTKLSALSTMIQDMNQQKVPASNVAGLAHIHGAASLIACADEVIRSGASLWNASVAEGSVSGGFHRPERTQWTTAWLQNISALHDPEIVNSSEENSPAGSVFSRSHVALFEPGNTPARGNPSISLETRQILEDDDHYLEHAMLRLGLQEGRQAVQERQWSAAYDHLKESLSLFSQLPDRSRAAYDVIELQYMLAISAFHSGEDLAIAKQALTSLTQRMPRNDKQRVIICNAKCLLARLYIRVGDLELAASSCQSASEGMRRLLGTQSDAYLEALALLVRIYELLENPRRARLVEMMIEDAPLVPQWISALSRVDQDLAADAVMKAITSKVYMQVSRNDPVVDSTDIASSPARTARNIHVGGMALPIPTATPEDLPHVALSARVTGILPSSTTAVSSVEHSRSPRTTLTRLHRETTRNMSVAQDERQLLATTSDQATSTAIWLEYRRPHNLGHGATLGSNATDPSQSELRVRYPNQRDGHEADGTPADVSGDLYYPTPYLKLGWENVTTIDAHMRRVGSLAFSPDSTYLASASEDKSCKLWDRTGKAVHTYQCPAKLASVDFSPNGSLLALGDHENRIWLWDTTTHKEVRRLGESRKQKQFLREPFAVWAVAFSPTGQSLASGYHDKRVRLWEVATGELLRTLEGHKGTVYTIAFLPDGPLMASGSEDGTIRLWDANSGDLVKELNGHAGHVYSVAFSPDGKFLASGSRDNTSKLWSTSIWEEVKVMEPMKHHGHVQGVAFSPDGETLATASADKTVRLWDVATLTRTSKLYVGRRGCVTAAFSPDGCTMAWTTEMGDVAFWNRKIATRSKKWRPSATRMPSSA